MTLELMRTVPKYDQIAPLSETCCSRIKRPMDELREQGRHLQKDLVPHWRPEKHLAFPKMRHAYALQLGMERVVYSKAPVYAEGGTAKCYIGQTDDGSFVLVRRTTASASTPPVGNRCWVDSHEHEVRQAFAPDLAPFWKIARASRKTPGTYKVYSVEPLLAAAAATLASHVKLTGQTGVFPGLLHHFMHDVATALNTMHSPSDDSKVHGRTYAHNDVKSDNVCVEEETSNGQGLPLRFRLIDFELASEAGAPLAASNVNIRPHELVKGSGLCQTEADMFSFGLACLQLILDEDPYRNIAAQDHQAPGFDAHHLQILAQFEAARHAAAKGITDTAGMPLWTKRFMGQWARVRDAVPAYLAEVIQGCVAWDVKTAGRQRRWTAQQVLDKLNAHPLPPDMVTQLRDCYATFSDGKQNLCKISAAILGGAFRARIRGIEGYELPQGLS